MMVFVVLLYVLIGACICYNTACPKDKKLLFTTWMLCFLCCAVYSYVSQLYVIDPADTEGFFLNPDQSTYYELSSRLTNLPLVPRFVEAYTDFNFHEFPLAVVYFSYLMDLADFLGISNVYLFLLVNSGFVGSLIPIVVYKLLQSIKYYINVSVIKGICIFFFFTPIFQYSCVLMRDTHVCLTTSLVFYYVLKENCKFRYILIFILAIVTTGLRVESGYFCFAMIAVHMFTVCRTSKSKMLKVAFILILGVMVILAGGIIYMKAIESVTGYSERTMDLAGSNSLGAKMHNLPIPLNIIAATLFGQLLPFPLWFPLSQYDAAWNWMRIVELVCPFYWTPISYYLFRYSLNYYKKVDLKLLLVALSALALVLAISYGEFHVRRLMVAYPLFYVLFLKVVKREIFKPFKKKVCAGVIFLHLIYIVIKFL